MLSSHYAGYNAAKLSSSTTKIPILQHHFPAGTGTLTCRGKGKATLFTSSISTKKVFNGDSRKVILVSFTRSSLPQLPQIGQLCLRQQQLSTPSPSSFVRLLMRLSDQEQNSSVSSDLWKPQGDGPDFGGDALQP